MQIASFSKVHNQKNHKVSLSILLSYGTGSTITIIRIVIWLDKPKSQSLNYAIKIHPTVIGLAVSSNQYSRNKPEDIIPINVSILQAPYDQVILEFLDTNSTVMNDTGSISGYTLCFNTSTTVRDALLNAMVPIDVICGSCSEFAR